MKTGAGQNSTAGSKPPGETGARAHRDGMRFKEGINVHNLWLADIDMSALHDQDFMDVFARTLVNSAADLLRELFRYLWRHHHAHEYVACRENGAKLLLGFGSADVFVGDARVRYNGQLATHELLLSGVDLSASPQSPLFLDGGPIRIDNRIYWLRCRGGVVIDTRTSTSKVVLTLEGLATTISSNQQRRVKVYAHSRACYDRQSAQGWPGSTPEARLAFLSGDPAKWDLTTIIWLLTSSWHGGRDDERGKGLLYITDQNGVEVQRVPGLRSRLENIRQQHRNIRYAHATRWAMNRLTFLDCVTDWATLFRTVDNLAGALEWRKQSGKPWASLGDLFEKKVRQTLMERQCAKVGLRFNNTETIMDQPSERSRHFFGRDVELAQLFGHLCYHRDQRNVGKGSSLSGVRRVVFITGMAGVGKTALATEFICDAVGKGFFDGGVMTLHAANRQHLQKSLQYLSEQLGQPSDDEDQAGACVVDFISSLQESGRHFLVVFDGADDERKLLKTDIWQKIQNIVSAPTCSGSHGGGFVLVTSRWSMASLRTVGYQIQLRSLDPASATVMMKAYTNSSPIVGEARKQLDRLGGLPLAIEQVAQSVNDGNEHCFAHWWRTTSSYQIDDDPHPLPSLPSEKPSHIRSDDDQFLANKRSIDTLFNADYDALTNGARHVLCVLAICGSGPILCHIPFFEHLLADIGTTMQEGDVLVAVQLLVSRSFVMATPSSPTASSNFCLELHPLVKTFLLRSLGCQVRAILTQSAMLALWTCMESVEVQEFVLDTSCHSPYLCVFLTVLPDFLCVEPFQPVFDACISTSVQSRKWNFRAAAPCVPQRHRKGNPCPSTP